MRENALLVSRNGPLFIRGELELVTTDGSVIAGDSTYALSLRRVDA